MNEHAQQKLARLDRWLIVDEQDAIPLAERLLRLGQQVAVLEAEEPLSRVVLMTQRGWDALVEENRIGPVPRPWER